MRWKLTVKADHKDGTERVVKRYAWFPRTLDDDYCVWLEEYYVKQKYWIFNRKGEWNNRETWSESTEQRKFLNRIKDSEKYVQDRVDSSYTRAKRKAANTFRKRNILYK